MKQALSVVLTLGLVLALLAGCSGGAPAPTNAPVATSAPANAAPTAAAPTAAPSKAPAVTPTAAPVPTATKAPTPTAVARGGSNDVLDKMKSISSFSANMTVDAAGDVMEGTIAYANHKMRMDVTALGVSMTMIADREKGTAYMYNPEEKSALAVPYDEAMSQSGDVGDALDWEKSSIAPPKPLGEETVDGKACAVYEFTTADSTSKSWIEKATGFPIKMEMKADGETSTIHFTNVKIGNVDESLFTLPPDTDIIDMSSLMGGGGAFSGEISISADVSSDGLARASITGPVPAVLKENIPIPSGFDLVRDSGQRVDNGATDTFRAIATWSGDAPTQEIADFYDEALAEDWVPQGGVVDDEVVEVVYYQVDTDPVVSLTVQAETVGSGALVLGTPDYDEWLRKALELQPAKGNLILTLTIANGDPDEAESED